MVYDIPQRGVKFPCFIAVRLLILAEIYRGRGCPSYFEQSREAVHTKRYTAVLSVLYRRYLIEYPTRRTKAALNTPTVGLTVFVPSQGLAPRTKECGHDGSACRCTLHCVYFVPTVRVQRTQQRMINKNR